MANLIVLAPGGQASYASCGFTFTDFNSLANGSIVVASSADDNSTNLDDAVEISFSFANGATTTTAASRFDLYWLPLNQDASTYGDGSTSGATLPAASYRVAPCGVRTGVTSGNTLTGTFPIVPWPSRATGKWVIANRTGGALNATSAAAVKYRGYRFNTNG
jgi:hypothetical protein